MPSGKFPGYPEIFKIILKLPRLSGLSGNFPDCPDYPETSQIIRKLSRFSGNFPDHPETFQTIQKLSRPSENFPLQFQGLRAKTFRMRKNFPDGNATMPRWFLCLCFLPLIWTKFKRTETFFRKTFPHQSIYIDPFNQFWVIAT